MTGEWISVKNLQKYKWKIPRKKNEFECRFNRHLDVTVANVSITLWKLKEEKIDECQPAMTGVQQKIIEKKCKNRKLHDCFVTLMWPESRKKNYPKCAVEKFTLPQAKVTPIFRAQTLSRMFYAVCCVWLTVRAHTKLGNSTTATTTILSAAEQQQRIPLDDAHWKIPRTNSLSLLCYLTLITAPLLYDDDCKAKK